MVAFPKLSAPLVKDIRTGEGIAEWVLGVGVGALTAVGDVSIAKGVTTLTILTGIKALRRGLLKIVALQAGIGIGAPEQPAVVTDVEKKVEQVATGIVAPPVDPGTASPVNV